MSQHQILFDASHPANAILQLRYLIPRREICILTNEKNRIYIENKNYYQTYLVKLKQRLMQFINYISDKYHVNKHELMNLYF